MSEAIVIPFPRGRRSPACTDTAALNDIHALLTAPGRGADCELLADVGQILARTGRAMVRARDIDASTSLSPTGWPVALVDAEDTTVTVRQDPAATGLLIEITTRTAAESGAMTVSLDGRCLDNPCPPGGAAA